MYRGATKPGIQLLVALSLGCLILAHSGCGAEDTLFPAFTAPEQAQDFVLHEAQIVDALDVSPIQENIVALASRESPHEAATSIIELWDIAHARKTREIGEHEQRVNAIEFSPDGNRIATGSNDGSVRIWNPNGQILVHDFSYDSPVTSLAFDPTGDLLAVSLKRGLVQIREFPSGRVKHSTENRKPGSNPVSFHPDGTQIAFGSDDGAITLWDLGTESVTSTLVHDPQRLNWISGLDFSPDGDILASSGHDNRVRMWDLSNETPLRTLQGHRSGSMTDAVEFSPAGTRLAASSGNQIVVWNSARGTREIVLFGEPRNRGGLGLDSLDFDPTGTRVVANSSRGIYVWDVRNR